MKKCKIIRDGKLVSYSQIGDRVRKPDKNKHSEESIINNKQNTGLFKKPVDVLGLDFNDKIQYPLQPEAKPQDSFIMDYSKLQSQRDPNKPYSFYDYDPTKPFVWDTFGEVNNKNNQEYEKNGLPTWKLGPVAKEFENPTDKPRNWGQPAIPGQAQGVSVVPKENPDLNQKLDIDADKNKKKEGNGNTWDNIGSGLKAVGSGLMAISSQFRDKDKTPVSDKIGITGTHSVFNGTFADGGKAGIAINGGMELFGNAYAASQLDEGNIQDQLTESSKNVTASQKNPPSTSYDDLLNMQSQYKNMSHLRMTSASDFNDDTTGSIITNAIGSAASGAGTGAMVGGGWGALAGAVIGLGSSLFGAGSKQAKAVKAADKANKKIRDLNEQIDETNAFNMRGFDNAFTNIALNNVGDALRSFSAEGGYLVKPIKPSLDTKMEETRFEPILTNDKKEGKYGTSYKDGGVFELNNDDIDKLQKNGYIVEKV